MDFERHATLLFCAKSAYVQGNGAEGKGKMMNWEVLGYNAVSVLVSGFISFCIAKFVRAEAKLKIILKPESKKETVALMLKFWTKKDGISINKVKIFRLTIKTGFVCGVTFHDLYNGKKPSLHFDGMEIKDIQTLNNNGSRFHIPLGKSKNTLILNLNWIRKNTTAEFLIFAVKQDDYKKNNDSVRFDMGLLRGINIKTEGMMVNKSQENVE